VEGKPDRVVRIFTASFIFTDEHERENDAAGKGRRHQKAGKERQSVQTDREEAFKEQV